MDNKKLTPVRLIDLAVRDDGYTTRNDVELISLEFGKVMVRMKIYIEPYLAEFYVATDHFEPAHFIKEFNLIHLRDLGKITEERLMEKYNSGKGSITCSARYAEREFRKQGAHTHVTNPHISAIAAVVFEHPLTLKEMEAYTVALKNG